MNLGDLIIPVLVIGGAVVQWMARNKLKEHDHPNTPPAHPNSDHAPAPRTEWNDLMEALGQKPAIPPAQTQVTPPPPLPPVKKAQTHRPVKTPTRVPMPDRPMSKFDEIIPPETNLETRAGGQPGDRRHLKTGGNAGPLQSVETAKPPGKLRLFLRDKPSLRDAVVLKEILSTPVGLRG
ncbi:MAG: hypothetical protein PHD76_05875 [Methylacidiphilales bacterium]|nr:hypothetical protein [Candidatus Methylacidiphilales bacterium]